MARSRRNDQIKHTINEGTKMTFISLTKLANIQPGLGRPKLDCDVSFHTHITGRNKKKATFAMVIRLSKSIAKQARLIHGDKIDIAFDVENRMGLIRRVTASQWALSNNRIQITIREGMPTTAERVACPAEVTPEGIQFILPDCVSFTKNMRLEHDRTNK